MAPISKTIVWAALAAMVSARPLVARDPAPDMVTETAWTTVDVPVTLWVDENGQPLSTVAQGGNFAAIPTPSASSVASSVTSTTTPAAQAPSPPVQSPSTLLTTTSSKVQQQPEPVATSTTTPAPVAPSSAAVVPSSPPAPAASSSAPASPASGGSESRDVVASSTNNCEGTGSACEGDITHYDGGLGACGWNVNTASDMQVALPVGFMGSQSNGNPYCGRSLTIQNPTTGQTVSATVGDKCMGCSGRSIDLTDALFNAIGNGCDGRCSGFEWWFN